MDPFLGQTLDHWTFKPRANAVVMNPTLGHTHAHQSAKRLKPKEESEDEDKAKAESERKA